MRKKIYIHIGTHKTGTTAVQLFSIKNTNILKTLNIHYAFESRPKDKSIQYGHHLLPWFLMDRHSHYFEEYINNKEKMIFALINEIKTSQCDNIILSSEAFSLLNIEQIDRLKKYLTEFDVHIIMYLRRKDSLIETMYQTNVMNYNESRSLDDSINKMGIALNYYEFVEKWKNIFGEDKVHVKLYCKNILKKNDIVVDFYNLFDIDITDIVMKTKSIDINKTIPLQYTDLIANLLRVNASQELIQDIKRISRESFSDEKMSYHILPLEDRVKYSKSGYDEVKKLNLKIANKECLLIPNSELKEIDTLSKIEVFQSILNNVTYTLKEEALKALELIQNSNIIKKKTKGEVLVFGDSHSSYYEIGKLLPNHIIKNDSILGYKVKRFGFPGASVKGVGRRDSSLNITDKILEKIGSDDIVVLVLGQVDIELGIYYRRFVLEINDTQEVFVKDCMLNYRILIDKVRQKAKGVIIKGINMPINIDRHRAIEFTKRIITENLKEKHEIDRAYTNLNKGMPDILERIAMAQRFNNALQEMCIELEIEYFDINKEICYPVGMVREEFIAYELDTHLILSLKIIQIHFSQLKIAIKNILKKS